MPDGAASWTLSASSRFLMGARSGTDHLFLCVPKASHGDFRVKEQKNH